MELYYIFGFITLTLSVLIGLRLRKAGKEIENNNLTDAGNYWLIINGLSILLTIIMLSKAGLLSFPSVGGSGVCDCADMSVAMMNEMTALDGDMEKMTEITEKYADDMKKCEAMGDGKSDEEMKAMEEEMKGCASFKEMEKMMGGH